ncbi:DNA-binding XRE family transcriptional regulator [Evansella vedderi]|uniref:DNA-binding XRE family transcriptional regulator n=1 Tax=Evansella vedderi TaxID=38282 RepID=A0ABU0A4B6_9BACI|nr:helix-turn-helix transcriptional regulator [Evansella vedderi]MDQ0257949.1 DNA-binding XRE family transcriptional regulator [Evansella vedderi]
MRLTLRQARLNCYLSEKEAAKLAGLPLRTLKRLEADCFDVSRENLIKLLRLYEISAEHVYLGKEADCLNKQNKATSLGTT